MKDGAEGADEVPAGESRRAGAVVPARLVAQRLLTLPRPVLHRRAMLAERPDGVK